MKVKFILMVLIFTCWGSGTAESLDWISLHNFVGKLNYEDAQKYLKNDSEDIEQKYVKGLIYLKYYNNEEAKLVFKDILSSDPTLPEARWGLAEALKSLHQYEESEPMLYSIVDEKKDFAPAIMSLAHLAYLRCSLKEVVNLTSQIIQMGKDQVDSETRLYAHGLYSAAHGLLTENADPLTITFHGYTSLRHLRIIRKLDPESFIYYFAWGNFYMLAPKVFGGDLNKAKKYYQKVVDLNPNFPDAYVRLYEIYKKQGDTQKSEEYMNKALELDPHNALAEDILKQTCQFLCLERPQQCTTDI